MRAVNFVDWNTTSCFADLKADELAFNSEKLFPTVCAAVTGINCAGNVIDEEYPEVAVRAIAGCSKGSAILGEINDVVNPDCFNIDRAHGTPPSNLVVKAATRGVNPWRRAPVPPLTTLATNAPATERVRGWVKFISLFLIDTTKYKVCAKEMNVAGLTAALAIYR